MKNQENKWQITPTLARSNKENGKRVSRRVKRDASFEMPACQGFWVEWINKDKTS